MRFIVDECTGPAISEWLISRNNEVFSVFDNARGVDDEFIINKAYAEGWVLITNDKDFGQKVFRDGRLHKGVILLRLDDERPANKISVLEKVLNLYSNILTESFIVVTDTQIRIAHSK